MRNDIPNEPLWPVPEIGEHEHGLTYHQVFRYERDHGVVLRSIKMPGGKNARRLTCNSWVRAFLAELDTLSRKAPQRSRRRA